MIAVSQLIASKQGNEYKVRLAGTEVCAGWLFEADGKGAGWFYQVGPRNYRSGSRKGIVGRFKRLKDAKRALAGVL